jgi:hypothetical protein
LKADRSCSGPRTPSWLSASGSESPARTPAGQVVDRLRPDLAQLDAALAPAPAHQQQRQQAAKPPNSTPSTGTWDVPSTTTNTSTPRTALAPNSWFGVTPSMPACTSRSFVRSVTPSPARTAAGARRGPERQTSRQPSPNSRPRSSPTLHRAVVGQQLGQVDAGPLVALLVRRVAVGPDQPLTAVTNRSATSTTSPSTRPGTATISRHAAVTAPSLPVCTTMSMQLATVGTTKPWPTFSPASSGSVHILTIASRAELAWIEHMPGSRC